jgi:hypothetical protein
MGASGLGTGHISFSGDRNVGNLNDSYHASAQYNGSNAGTQNVVQLGLTSGE